MSNAKFHTLIGKNFGYYTLMPNKKTTVRIYFSYNTIVGYVKLVDVGNNLCQVKACVTNKKYSATTSRHVNYLINLLDDINGTPFVTKVSPEKLYELASKIKGYYWL